MLGEVEEQMATVVWQVPRQMFAVARAAIYITVQHRHANICKKGQGALFVPSQCGHRQKQMGLNILGIASSEMRNCIVL